MLAEKWVEEFRLSDGENIKTKKENWDWESLFKKGAKSLQNQVGTKSQISLWYNFLKILSG